MMDTIKRHNSRPMPISPDDVATLVFVGTNVSQVGIMDDVGREVPLIGTVPRVIFKYFFIFECIPESNNSN